MSEIYNKALAHFGKDAQVIKCVSECNELATVLLHYREEKKKDADVIDEIADVIICSRQMAILFGEDAVNDRIHYKMNRLRGMMDG